MSRSQWRVPRKEAQTALELLKAAQFVLFPTHQNVDADGLASPLALLTALEPEGVTGAVMVSDGELPSSLKFLPGSRSILKYGKKKLPKYDLICLADCSDLRRLGGFYADDPTRLDGSVPIVNIDHHVTNDRFGVVNIVEPQATSTAELVSALLRVWKVQPTREVAQCLLAGIYGDTLGLRTESTTTNTMRTAADLIDAGAESMPIIDNLFRLKTPSTVCLWKEALAKVQWTGKIIWAEVSQSMLNRCGASAAEAEGLVNFLAGTEGSEVAAILYETDTGWRVSLRSLDQTVDVAQLAALFGGGGHPRAAGVQIEGKGKAKMRFLDSMAIALDQQTAGV